MSKSAYISGDWDETVNGEYDIVAEYEVDGITYLIIRKPFVEQQEQ